MRAVSKQVADVETLFLHERDGSYIVGVERDGKRVLQGVLEVKETSAGTRPARLRVKTGDDEDLRAPDQFVDIARRARRIRISGQTAPAHREALGELFEGYQLEVKVVRTCRTCANTGRFAPITEQTAIAAEGESICPSCAIRELEREAEFRGLRAGARDRLEELLLEVGDLGRIRTLLKGNLDPELTRFDTISATTEDVEPIAVDSLPLDDRLMTRVTDRHETLLPVQSLAVEHGALEGSDQLVVSATATGKTLIGELAGVERILAGEGKMLFLVPLVALANQKHESFTERYGDIANVSIRVGASRINDDGNRFDPDADIIVGTYEGIDHALRTGRDLGTIGTVVIDEIHTLGQEGRGHRLDGLISRLKHYTEQGTTAVSRTGASEPMDTQWVYLSATVGNPGQLAGQLEATLIEFEERPVPIERHVTFASDGLEKTSIENKLVRRAFDSTSSKGYRGQTIIFTNSRRRCHEISRRLEYDAAPYHAGLDYGRRKQVERRFANQDLAAVVTTAALAAGVDFPASQVIFDSLAMGIEWLTVQEFSQMLGRAGRPDYHDTGTVYLLVEPDCSYHSSMEASEDETAFRLLKGEMEPVVTRYPEAAALEETLANLVVGGASASALNDRMVGEVPTRHALGRLIEFEFIEGLAPTPMGEVICRHFLAPEEAFTMLEAIRTDRDPAAIVGAVEMLDEH
jgi:helicase